MILRAWYSAIVPAQTTQINISILFCLPARDYSDKATIFGSTMLCTSTSLLSALLKFYLLPFTGLFVLRFVFPFRSVAPAQINSPSLLRSTSICAQGFFFGISLVCIIRFNASAHTTLLTGKIRCIIFQYKLLCEYSATLFFCARSIGERQMCALFSPLFFRTHTKRNPFWCSSSTFYAPFTSYNTKHESEKCIGVLILSYSYLYPTLCYYKHFIIEKHWDIYGCLLASLLTHVCAVWARVCMWYELCYMPMIEMKIWKLRINWRIKWQRKQNIYDRIWTGHITFMPMTLALCENHYPKMI